MDLTHVGIIGIIILIIFLFSNMPVGFVMGLVGLGGFIYVKGLGPGLNLLASDVFDIFSSYGLTVIPLFVLMGQLSFQSGIFSIRNKPPPF